MSTLDEILCPYCDAVVAVELLHGDQLYQCFACGKKSELLIELEAVEADDVDP